MTKNKKTQTAKRGFTLVEVIVVAVIVLILSAVAIPMYNGFVKQARKDVVDNLAETAAAAANAHWRRTNATVTDADLSPNGSLKLHYDITKHTVEILTSKPDFLVAKELDSYKSDAITSDEVRFKN